MSLTSAQIQTRLLQISCYIGCLADSVAKDLRYGIDNKQKINTLSTVSMYFKTLKRNLIQDEVRAVAKIKVVAGSSGTYTLTPTYTGVDLLTAVPINLPNGIQAIKNVAIANEMVDLINASQPSTGFYAEKVPNTAEVHIFAPIGAGSDINTTEIAITETGDVDIEWLYNAAADPQFLEGVDVETYDDVCLTEDEVEDILKHVSTLTGICYDDTVHESPNHEDTDIYLVTNNNIPIISNLVKILTIRK